MEKAAKTIICIILCLAMCFGFGGCSSNELSESNVTATVDKVEQAFKDLNVATLAKYIKFGTLSNLSSSLGEDVNLADSISVSDVSQLKPFVSLCDIMFANLEIEINSINLEEMTVDVSITNADYYQQSMIFAYNLKKNYNLQELLSLMANQQRFEEKLGELITSLEETEVQTKTIEATLTIEQGDKNLVLVLDKNAERAITGGVLTSIMTIYGIGATAN